MNNRFPLPYCSQLFNKGIGSHDFFQAVAKELPAIFSRETASRAIGGLISARTMANEDSKGVGPMAKAKIGNRVAYTREDFLEWLRRKVKINS